MGEDIGVIKQVNGSFIDTSVYKPKRKTLKIGSFNVNVTLANVFFAFLTVAGEVGQNVSLPLWIDSSTSATGEGNAHSADFFDMINNNSFAPTNSSNAYQPRVDGFFVYFFASTSFVVLFGVVLTVIRIFQPHQLGATERRFPHTQLFLVGFFDAVNGTLVVFASSGKRTAPYLQSILGNFMIPLVMALRYFILRKVPTRRKLICATVVLISIFICLIPKIFTSLDSAPKRFGGASGLAGILWPLCFMFGYIPMALMHVYEERGLKREDSVSQQQVNVIFFFFWTSFYELITVIALFWLDYIPVYGYADNLDQFMDNFVYGFKCMFGGEGCSWYCGVLGLIHITTHMVDHIGAGLLMRFSEGAAFLAIVQAIVTPVGFLFWTIFRESPFSFHPAIQSTTWFSISALVPMVPAIFFYNTGESEKDRIIVDPERSSLLQHPRGFHAEYSFSISEHPSLPERSLTNSLRRGPLIAFNPSMLM